MNQRGLSVIEIIIASAVFVIFASGVMSVVLQGLQGNRLGLEQTIAIQYASEGLEAARSIKNQDFINLINTAGTGISQSGGVWIFSGASNTFDKYTRTISISDVQRDGNENIITSGGTVDPYTKKVSSQVTWNFNSARGEDLTLTTYLTNWKKSLGNWGLPALDTSFNLTVANSGNATADSQTVAFANKKVYLGRLNSTGDEFYIFNVSNPSTPTLLGKRALNGTPNSILINGNYAYIASDDDASELQIIDISDPTTINQAGKLTTVDLTAGNSGNDNANGIALSISGNYLVMIRDAGDEFLIFDLTNPNSPGDPIGRLATLVGVPTDIVISGNYAFVTSTDDTNELQIFDITTKTAPSRVATYDLNSGNTAADARSIALAGTSVIIGRLVSTAPELYALNISNPLSPGAPSTLEIGSNVLAIDYDNLTSYAFLVTADTANDFKVIDTATISAMTLLGQLNLNNSPMDLVYNSELNKVFIGNSNNTQELQIVKSQ